MRIVQRFIPELRRKGDLKSVLEFVSYLPGVLVGTSLAQVLCRGKFVVLVLLVEVFQQTNAAHSTNSVVCVPNLPTRKLFEFLLALFLVGRLRKPWQALDRKSSEVKGCCTTG